MRVIFAIFLSTFYNDSDDDSGFNSDDSDGRAAVKVYRKIKRTSNPQRPIENSPYPVLARMAILNFSNFLTEDALKLNAYEGDVLSKL